MDNTAFNHDQFVSSLDSWINQVRAVSASDNRLTQVLTKLQEIRTIVAQYRDRGAA